MACKMLFFDYRKPEEHFFKKHKLENFDIKFFEESLNESCSPLKDLYSKQAHFST